MAPGGYSLTSLTYGLAKAVFDAYFDSRRESLKADAEIHTTDDDVRARRIRDAVQLLDYHPTTSGTESSVGPAQAIPAVAGSPG